MYNESLDFKKYDNICHFPYFILLFLQFLLDIFSFTFQMLSQKSSIPSHHPAPLPTHSHFLALSFPCTGAYKVCNTKGPLFPMMAD